MKFSRKTKASLEAALTCAISQSDFVHHNALNHCNIGLLTRTCEQFFNFQAVSNQAIQKIRVEVFFNNLLKLNDILTIQHQFRESHHPGSPPIIQVTQLIIHFYVKDNNVSGQT